MPDFVDLSRRFRKLTQKELDEPELLALANEKHYLPSLSWSELLEHPRVLVLAEAGSGKTREMQERVAKLRNDGKRAFFLAIESLDRESLPDCLGANDEKLFNAWKTGANTEAYFFLDAVDELKLTGGTLERALRRFAKAVDGRLDQISVVVTCRPSDWRPTVDMAKLQEILPYAPLKKDTAPEGEIFLSALTEKLNSKTRDTKPEFDKFIVVSLLPLSERQIATFATSLGVSEIDAFIKELRIQDAWTFARRPLDLSELAAMWNSSGKLGTRREQHESNANAKLKDDPSRADADQLTNERAREGAERLALATALTRTRTILAPEQTVEVERVDGALDASVVLKNWSHVERRSLLSRALFDPATYGRVRFHHRSVQEYLAACRLRRLREKGLSIKTLFRFLFAERYGVKVVVPSMRPIAAWLALWEPNVRNELTRREPETLLSEGDPESLTVEMRASLVRSFAELYGGGGWRGLRIPGEDLRRLAHPELANTIKNVWGKGPPNSDVRDLLLNLISEGGIAGCVEIAERAAMSRRFSDYERVIAIRGIIASNRPEKVRKIAQSIYLRTTNWPDRVVHGVAADLFPSSLSVNELLELVERTPEPSQTTSGFGWQMQEIARTIDPGSTDAIELVKKLSALIWKGRSREQKFYEITGRYNYLAEGLALLCNRRLSLDPLGSNDPTLVRACAIANRFGKGETGSHESLGELRDKFGRDPEMRAAAFWTEVDLMSELVPPKTDRDRMYFAEHESLVSHLEETDRSWLESALSDRSNRNHRVVALQALGRLHWAGKRGKREGRALVTAVNDDAVLKNEAIALITPVPENAEWRRMNEQEAKRRRAQKRKENERLTKWKKWREELKADPARAFASSELDRTLSNLYKWLRLRLGSNHRYNVWDQTAIAQGFGQDIAQRATGAFKTYWRAVRPALWTERAPAEQNSTPWVWLYGLCGIAAEASSKSWASHLTAAEAETASRYAILELNGFPSWLAGVAEKRPVQVDSILGVELTKQIKMSQEFQHLPLLQDLSHAEDSIKRIFARRCQAALMIWPATFADDDAEKRSSHNLSQVLQVLADAVPTAQRSAIASECARRFAVAQASQLGLTWLRGLFRFDPVAGARMLQKSFALVKPSSRAKLGVELLASLFGEREGIPLSIADNATRAIVLKEMLISAYRYVPPREDKRHEGVYTPNTRDHAERARSFLLQTLLDTPGVEARNVILELSGNPLFSHFADRLRLLARERAAKDAEFEPFSYAQIADLEGKLETIPNNRDGLFEVMMDRLDDLAHDVAHHDFTDRRTVRTIKGESEMQRNLARRLEDMSKGAYIVIREEEVADGKKTDIRLATPRGGHRAAIEVKIADKRWTITEFERALRSQLVGQYLRHGNCKAGCLLLTYDGSKKYWQRPNQRGRLSFEELLKHLNGIAERLAKKNNHDYRISVFGLSLIDPVLAPAHRRQR